ncbi:MAG TPA: 30S ribosomal protein S4e [archaeon]|nr:30S ribosomal protein S4e [archaeon]
MKRLLAPKFWPVKRKEKKFVGTPSPGPHSSNFCIPMTVLLRDVFSFAADAKEARTILTSRKVKINGKVKTDKNYPVGLMDIVEVGNHVHRVVVGKDGLYVSEIDKKDAFQMLQIRNKSIVKKSKVQLNFHDGTNILADGKSYSTGDVLVVKDGKISDVLPFEKGAAALIIKGNNAGITGKIGSIIIKKGSHKNEVILETKKRKLLVPKDYIFILGKDKPLVAVGGSDV